jgi:hypothetical protein
MKILAVFLKGVGEVGDGRGPHVCWSFACLTCVLMCIGIAFSAYVVAIVSLTYVLICESDSNEEEIEKVFDKSLWRVNDNFFNVFYKVLLLMVDSLFAVQSHYCFF